MNLSLLILLLVIVVFIICFMYIEPIISKHKIKNNNEYGSARFSTEAEINKYLMKLVFQYIMIKMYLMYGLIKKHHIMFI